MEHEILQLNILRLCSSWLNFLDHAGKYATRYYLALNLELPLGEQNPKKRTAMVRIYQTEARLLATIQRDLETFPEELCAIRDAQMGCSLPNFSDRADYLARITMGFTMLDRHGKERRAYYRRRINKMLQAAKAGQAVALSLNQLEAGFTESQRKAAIRRAKKAA